MSVLVTGAAGFIGYHVCEALLARGDEVIGVDNINDYYDTSLKDARLARLMGKAGFTFCKLDIAQMDQVLALAEDFPEVTGVVHLAAQAGVRYSLVNPSAYTRSNVEGQLAVLELCRKFAGLKHLVYASSSSVYGTNDKLPFSVEDRVDEPVSLYAATKKAGEMMGHCYSHLYRIPTTGLRFFTVYGPWGRPDMAPSIFAGKIFSGQALPVFNNGKMRRDFTYIDDIVAGVLSCLDRPPVVEEGSVPHRIYNLGNNKSEALMDFIKIMEEAAGKKVEIDFQPMQPGDVPETYADIVSTTKDLGFKPSTSLKVGLPKFVAWYRDFYGV